MSEFQDRPADLTGEEKSPAARGSAVRFILSLPRLLLSRYGLAALGAVLLGVLIYLTASADGFIRSSELEREMLKLRAEIAALEDANRLLTQTIQRLKNDPAYVEDEARKKLGLVRPGEIIYRLAEEPDLADDRPAEPPVIP